MNGPTIYRLIIEDFRGVKTLEWHPSAGMNLILGGGDVGKTTVLDAIGPLLSPTNPAILSDADAEQDQNASPITLVDEVERGLEPYRQRNANPEASGRPIPSVCDDAQRACHFRRDERFPLVYRL